MISLAAEADADALRLRLKNEGLSEIEVVYGAAGTVRVATHPDVDFVVSAIVGVAGLEATLEAVRAGKEIGLANKECLVAAGDLITAEARKQNVPLLADRQRTQCRTPVHARRADGRSRTRLAYRFRRSFQEHATV